MASASVWPDAMARQDQPEDGENALKGVGGRRWHRETPNQATSAYSTRPAVSPLDQTTQKNAALVEESAAAVSLNTQAQELVAAVGRFRLADGAGY